MAREIVTSENKEEYDKKKLGIKNNDLTLYHGSPNYFTNFDISKENTGAGHQNFGHGVYLSSSKNVSKHYKSEKLTDNKNGHLYEVNVSKEHKDKILDWDKPISEQTEHIKNLYNKFTESELGKKADKSLNNYISQKKGEYKNPTGKDLHSAIYEAHASKEGNENKKTSEYLEKNGLIGIKYMDYKSGNAEHGVQNHVIFNPKHIKIKKINNKSI